MTENNSRAGIGPVPDPPAAEPVQQTPAPDPNDDLRQGAQQMMQGASKLASGAAHFTKTRIAPAIEQGAKTARTQFDERSKAAGGFLPLATWYAPVLVLVAAAVHFTGLFLPLHRNTSYMEAPNSDGYVVIAMLVVASGFAIARIRRRGSKALRIGAGLAALLVGLLSVYSTLLNLSSLGPSFGLTVIGLGSITMVTAGSLILINKEAPAER